LEFARRGATPPDVLATVARRDLRHPTRQRRVPSAGHGRVAGRPIDAATTAWLSRGRPEPGPRLSFTSFCWTTPRCLKPSAVVSATAYAHCRSGVTTVRANKALQLTDRPLALRCRPPRSRPATAVIDCIDVAGRGLDKSNRSGRPQLSASFVRPTPSRPPLVVPFVRLARRATPLVLRDAPRLLSSCSGPACVVLACKGRWGCPSHAARHHRGSAAGRFASRVANKLALPESRCRGLERAGVT